MFFIFCQISNQIDVSRANFLRKFMANENATCQMFVEKAELNLRKILSHYNAISVKELKTVNKSMFVWFK